MIQFVTTRADQNERLPSSGYVRRLSRRQLNRLVPVMIRLVGWTGVEPATSSFQN